MSLCSQKKNLNCFNLLRRFSEIYSSICMCTSNAYILILTGTPGWGSRSIKLNGNLSITSLSFGPSLGGWLILNVDFLRWFLIFPTDLALHHFPSFHPETPAWEKLCLGIFPCLLFYLHPCGFPIKAQHALGKLMWLKLLNQPEG